MNSTALNSFQDASGLVTVSVFERRGGTSQQHWHDFRIDVGPDMVAIGGGGEAARLPEGALLTASYPDDDLRAWLVSSKDHMKPNHHQLTGYAIGLKIEGMSRDALLDKIHVSRNESSVAQHPEASASLPDGYKLISGGFKVNWTGKATWLQPRSRNRIFPGKHVRKIISSPPRPVCWYGQSESEKHSPSGMSSYRSRARALNRHNIPQPQPMCCLVSL